LGFVVQKLALGYDFLQVLQFTPVRFISPLLRTHLHTTLIPRIMGQEAWEHKNNNLSLSLSRIFGITGKKTTDSHLSDAELNTAEREEENSHDGLAKLKFLCNQ
jgi:hypothetical protein